MTGAARNTITSLLVQLGTACAAYQDRTCENLTSTRIECDEIWSFCYAKAKNVPEEHGRVRLRRRVDVDRHRPRDQARAVVARRNARDGRDGVHRGPRLAACNGSRSPRTDIAYRGPSSLRSEPDVDYALLIKAYGVEHSPDASPTARRYSPNVVTRRMSA